MHMLIFYKQSDIWREKMKDLWKHVQSNVDQLFFRNPTATKGKIHACGLSQSAWVTTRACRWNEFWWMDGLAAVTSLVGWSMRWVSAQWLVNSETNRSIGQGKKIKQKDKLYFLVPSNNHNFWMTDINNEGCLISYWYVHVPQQPTVWLQTGWRRQNCSLHRMLGGKVADRNSM